LAAFRGYLQPADHVARIVQNVVGELRKRGIA